MNLKSEAPFFTQFKVTFGVKVSTGASTSAGELVDEWNACLEQPGLSDSIHTECLTMRTSDKNFHVTSRQASVPVSFSRSSLTSLLRASNWSHGKGAGAFWDPSQCLYQAQFC